MNDTRRLVLQIVLVFIIGFGLVALTYVNNLHAENLRKINTEYDLEVRKMEEAKLKKVEEEK